MSLRFSPILLAIFLSACLDTRTQQRGPEKPTAEQQTTSSEAELLGRGDVIEVKVFREPELGGIYPVGHDGHITFPMIGKVKVSERDSEMVAKDIRERLISGQYFKDPEVAVVVRERTAQKVHVWGQVEKQGTFGFRSGMNVIEAITDAGGFTRLAATNDVRITRVIGSEERVFKVQAGDIGQGKAPNFALEPGDIIYVPESVF